MKESLTRPNLIPGPVGARRHRATLLENPLTGEMRRSLSLAGSNGLVSDGYEIKRFDPVRRLQVYKDENGASVTHGLSTAQGGDGKTHDDDGGILW